MKDVSVILPCRNEEKAIGQCISSIESVFKKNNVNGEIIVSDSSTDNSPKIARQFNVKLVKHDKQGYGIAYMEGIKVAEGDKLFLADADGTYDFKEIPRFMEALDSGSDFVIGNRFNKKMNKNVMPWLHYYIGNPLLSYILRIFFNAKVRDAHCGMRMLKKETFEKLNLQTTGMEFASEMIVKAVKNKLRIKELDIEYHVRRGESKLKTFSDGWRHLRFMFLYSPLFLFFIPGLILFLLGFISMIYFCMSTHFIFGVRLYFHPLFFSSTLLILGYQIISFAFFAKIYAVNHLGEKNFLIEKLYKYITLEKTIVIGSLMGLLGFVVFVMVFTGWVKDGFNEMFEVKKLIVALTFVVIGTQTIFSGFMLSILGIKDK